jgi:ABC-type iron transport system FetAB ATPase subunit
VIALAKEIGFEGVDAGHLDASRNIENLGLLVGQLAYGSGFGNRVFAARLCSVVSRSTGTTRKRFNCTEMEKKSMPAYLVYICQGVSDRKELETYWKDMPPTFMGFDVKLHTVYRPFELLERVGLDDFARKKPHELSGGMRQRVAICRALVYDPELLLMDEPFSALDAITRDEMNELLLDLWQQYTKTALFVTHSIREAVFLADRVLVMTRRPSTIVEDLTIPFARPRPMAIGESREFNEICGHLRERIEANHYRRAAPIMPRRELVA